jgi:hypothetical protein
VSAAFAVLLIVGAVAGFSPDGHTVAAHVQVPGDQLTGLPAGAVAPNDVAVAVRVEHPPHAAYAWAAARDLAQLVLLGAALWLLRGLLRSVRDRNPFTDANVRRLRSLGGVVIVGVPVALLLSSFFASELADSTRLDSPGLMFRLPGNALIGGLAVLALAEVFAAGVRMRVDLEGTV